MSPRLSSADIYCGTRITSDDRLQAYHIYKIHPEKIKECFEDGYPNMPLIVRTIMSKKQAYKLFLQTMKEVDEQETKLK